MPDAATPTPPAAAALATRRRRRRPALPRRRPRPAAPSGTRRGDAGTAARTSSGPASRPAAPGSPSTRSTAPTSTDDVPVTMADGTVLRADVIYPTDPATGQPAAGPVPGGARPRRRTARDRAARSAAGSAEQPGGGSPTGGANDYLVQRGFIDVVADVRGTGDSGGSWGLFDPVQTSDGVTLVNWAAKLPHRNGKVGTYGAVSYLGINQMLLAGAIGQAQPAQGDLPGGRRPTTSTATPSFMGGLLDTRVRRGLPRADRGGQHRQPGHRRRAATRHRRCRRRRRPVEAAARRRYSPSYHAGFTAETLAGGADRLRRRLLEGPRARRPCSTRSSPTASPPTWSAASSTSSSAASRSNYAGLQNAWAGRPTTAPMTRRPEDDRPLPAASTARGSTSTAPRSTSTSLELAWFDQLAQGRADRHRPDADPAALLRPRARGALDRDGDLSRSPAATPDPATTCGARHAVGRAAPRPRRRARHRWPGPRAGNPCGRPVGPVVDGRAVDPVARHAGLTAPCAERRPARRRRPGPH